MIPLLIERELQTALRRKVTQRRFWAAVGGVLLTAFYVGTQRSVRAGGNSQEFFQMLLFISSAIAVFETAHFSLDLVARERRSNTLGLLVLTGLSGAEIFLAKLTAALVLQLANGLALLPCFAVCFVLGGVPASAFLAVAAFVPNVTVLTLAISLAASTLVSEEDEGLVVAGGLGALILLGGPAVYYALLSLSPTPDPRWLWLSPGYGLYLIWGFFTKGSPTAFWMNSALTAAYSFAFIAGATFFLQRTWREGPGIVRLLRAWRGDETPAISTAARQPQLRPLLESNPSTWLGLRDKTSVKLAWITSGALGAGWIIGAWLWPGICRTLVGGILAAVVMNGAVGIIAMFSAAKRTAEDRRSGALELLLTTPLSVGTILEGERRALMLAFKPVLWFVLALNAIMAMASAWGKAGDPIALAVTFEAWAVLAFFVRFAFRSHMLSSVIWAALNSARPLLVVRKLLCPPGVLLAVGFFGYSIAQSGWVGDFPAGSPEEFWVVSAILIAAVVLSSLAGHLDPVTEQLKDNFRKVAQRPVPEPTDPRFRNWDPRKPFPSLSPWILSDRLEFKPEAPSAALRRPL